MKLWPGLQGGADPAQEVTTSGAAPGAWENPLTNLQRLRGGCFLGDSGSLLVIALRPGFVFDYLFSCPLPSGNDNLMSSLAMLIVLFYLFNSDLFSSHNSTVR